MSSLVDVKKQEFNIAAAIPAHPHPHQPAVIPAKAAYFYMNPPWNVMKIPSDMGALEYSQYKDIGMSEIE